MMTDTLPSNPLLHYSLEMLQDEVRHLVENGTLSRHQHIYSLCQYIPAREWVCLENELEKGDYLLRDRIADLLGSEKWDSD